MAAEEKRKAQREQAFIPPVEEKPKKENKKKGWIYSTVEPSHTKSVLIWYHYFNHFFVPKKFKVQSIPYFTTLLILTRLLLLNFLA